MWLDICWQAICLVFKRVSCQRIPNVSNRVRKVASSDGNKTKQNRQTRLLLSIYLHSYPPTYLLNYIFIFHVFHRIKANNLEKPNESLVALAANPIYSPWDMISHWWCMLTQAHLPKTPTTFFFNLWCENSCFANLKTLLWTDRIHNRKQGTLEKVALMITTASPFLCSKETTSLKFLNPWVVKSDFRLLSGIFLHDLFLVMYNLPKML